MALKTNLRQRGTRFHFRRKLTSQFAARIGRTEIVFSLKTGNARLAAIRARQAWLAIEGVLRSVADRPNITKEQIEDLVRQAVEAFEWEDEIRLARDGSLFTIGGYPPPDAEAMLLEYEAEQCRAELATNDISGVKKTIRRHAQATGLKIEEGSIDERLVGRALLRALAEKFDRDAETFRRERLPYQTIQEAGLDEASWEEALHDEIDRASSGYDLGESQSPASRADEAMEAQDQAEGSSFAEIYPDEAEGAYHSFRDHTVPVEHDDPALTSHSPRDGLTAQERELRETPLSEAWKVYAVDEVAVSKIRESNVRHRTSSLYLWIDICGDQPAYAYTNLDSSKFRRTIAQLPANYHRDKRWRNLSAMEIVADVSTIEQKNRERLPRKDQRTPLTIKFEKISVKTINKHLSALRGFWRWMRAHGYLAPQHPDVFAGLHINIKKSLYEVQEERDQWPPEMIGKLFKTPIWTGCRSHARRTEPGTYVHRDWKYWVPLIGAYTGMRAEEICSMLVEEIQYSEKADLWYFNLRQSKRRFKTLGSERYVPIHSHLLSFGFLEALVKGRPGGEYLFPDMKIASLEDVRSDQFTKAFTYYRQQVKLYDPKIGFHSFRHSVVTAIMDHEDANRGFAEEITGHDGTERQSELSRYNKSDMLKKLKKTIEYLDYGFGISHLQKHAADAAAKAKRRREDDRVID
ncbi:tyrosine-type recombinase/integrase [Dongia sp.]|uniref:tyrosine-type recombinase/integrase n=1 Tax=Dongia sp. TaxID=1977262 RepID=UPI0035ADEDAA